MSALKLEKCQVAQKSQTSLDIQKLGRGILINISVPGPEWYLLDGGGLVAINGLAAGACKELPDYHEMLQRKEG